MAVNMIYFTVDHCASEMEAPFGDDLMDVDLSKIIRRIDKFTAALVSLYVGRPVMNYDVYPETRSTSATHELLKVRVRVRVRVSLRVRVRVSNANPNPNP